jgi:hypothetical protein
MGCENLDVLDESIETARSLSKTKKGGSSRDIIQGLKILRDLVEQRNTTLDRIKAHLLGRDETGAVREPEDVWDENPQIMYERYFKNELSPWAQDDLKLECEDCGVRSEQVSNYTFEHPYPEETERINLCEKCYEKRSEETEIETGERKDSVEIIGVPASKGDIRVILQSAGLMLKTLKGLPEDQRIAKLEGLLSEKFEVAPGMEPAYEAYRARLQTELDKLRRSS